MIKHVKSSPSLHLGELIHPEALISAMGKEWENMGAGNILNL